MTAPSDTSINLFHNQRSESGQMHRVGVTSWGFRCDSGCGMHPPRRAPLCAQPVSATYGVVVCGGSPAIACTKAQQRQHHPRVASSVLQPVWPLQLFLRHASHLQASAPHPTPVDPPSDHGNGQGKYVFWADKLLCAVRQDGPAAAAARARVWQRRPLRTQARAMARAWRGPYAIFLAWVARAWRGHGAGVARACPVTPGIAGSPVSPVGPSIAPVVPPSIAGLVWSSTSFGKTGLRSFQRRAGARPARHQPRLASGKLEAAEDAPVSSATLFRPGAPAAVPPTEGGTNSGRRSGEGHTMHLNSGWGVVAGGGGGQRRRRRRVRRRAVAAVVSGGGQRQRRRAAAGGGATTSVPHCATQYKPYSNLAPLC
eukprot:gene8763-biopygen1622